jgi:integrase
MTVVQPSSSSLLSPQFLKADGSTWRKSHQLRPMVEACRRAKIDPPINFHALHHTWTSLATINGVLLIVAKTLGHTDTRMSEITMGILPRPTRRGHPCRRAAIWEG